MTSNFNEKNRAAYDQIAGRYAERNAEMLPYVVEAAERMLGRLRTTGGLAQPVLDLGCGAGRDMAWLEGRGAAVVGGDLSRGMLAEARTCTRGPLVQLDMLALPFADGVFAAVWCQAALLHLPKALAPAALAEARRVLRAGGVLHVAVQRGQTEGIESRPYEPEERYYAHYQPEELRALLEGAGFVVEHMAEAQARRPWVVGQVVRR